jgi:hypothetical protein
MITVGPSRRAIASRQAAAVSLASAGRIVTRLGIARRPARCSIGWWVGPSSPSATESWVYTKIEGASISAASRIVFFM